MRRAPVARITTLGTGPEDVVALPLGDGRVRLFAREVCRASGCAETPERYRVGYADVTAESLPPESKEAFRPAGEFEPLGMSLVAGPRAGEGTLYVLDSVKPRRRIWQLQIENGDIARDRATTWFESDRRELRRGTTSRSSATPST